MPEEVIFRSETKESRGAVADYLRSVADRLESGDPVTLRAGDEEVTLDPPATVEFEVKAERETGAGETETSVEFELEWSDAESEASFEVA